MERQSPDTTVDIAQLGRYISKGFNIEELNNLCFDLNIEYEELRGVTRSGKARELVAYMSRLDRIYELVTECRELRPNIPWEDAVRHRSLDQNLGSLPKAQPQIVFIRIIQGTIIISLLVLPTFFVLHQLGIIPLNLPIPKYDITKRTNFTSLDDHYTFEYPQDWRYYNKTITSTAPTIIHTLFYPRKFPDFYAHISIELINENKIGGGDFTKERLAQFLTRYIGDTYIESVPEPTFDETVFPESRDKAVQVTWSGIQKGSTVTIRARSELRKHGDILSLITIYLPQDQFYSQQEQVTAIINSLKVPAPTAGQ